MEAFSDLFLKHYRNMNSMSKYFIFGTNSTSLNVSFSWYDSYTQRKVVTQSALFGALSSLYNFAVCLSRRACFMNLDGEGIKVASKLFQQAAWIFEHLITKTSQLPAECATCDF